MLNVLSQQIQGHCCNSKGAFRRATCAADIGSCGYEAQYWAAFRTPRLVILHSGNHNDEVQLCAFDVLAIDGEDLRELNFPLGGLSRWAFWASCRFIAAVAARRLAAAATAVAAGYCLKMETQFDRKEVGRVRGNAICSFLD
jgi:hypothetical protein